MAIASDRDHLLPPSPLPSAEERPQEAPASDKRSYGQILKSSALIGASSSVNVLFRILRVKVMALLLGPTGVGLLGLYTSVADVAYSLACMGIDSSGVRQIAYAVGTSDEERIARTVHALRRTTVILGALGAGLLVVLSGPVSRITFGTDEHAKLIALLSLAVFFRVVYAGQAALLHGMRRIADLAKMEVLGAVLATLIGIPLIYFLRDRGIVPFLVVTAAAAILISWSYSRSVQIRPVAMTAPQLRQEASALLRLGFAFMASGLAMMGVAYAVRVIVLREVGFEAAGYYQSAWTIGGFYVAFILQAMGTDFYPRLTAVAHDDPACNRLVNEQAQVSLLMAGPGVLATLTFAPLVVALFYSREFDAAVGTLRWLCLGMSLRVITWPMSFIFVAKGRQTLFVWIDLSCAAVQLGLAWVLVKGFGLDGAGMAFFGLYVYHGLLVYPIARRISGFRWSTANKRAGAIFVPLIALVFCGFFFLPPLVAAAVGTLAVVASGIYSARALARLVPLAQLPSPLRRLLVWFRLGG